MNIHQIGILIMKGSGWINKIQKKKRKEGWSHNFLNELYLLVFITDCPGNCASNLDQSTKLGQPFPLLIHFVDYLIFQNFLVANRQCRTCQSGNVY